MSSLFAKIVLHVRIAHENCKLFSNELSLGDISSKMLIVWWDGVGVLMFLAQDVGVQEGCGVI